MRIILVLVLLLVGCSPPENKQRNVNAFVNDSPLSGTSPIIVTVEGCEYIKTYGSHGEINYSHKGNCKNPIHSCERMMKLRTYEQ